MTDMTPVQALLDIMARLRDPMAGCPWDVEQTFKSIAPYTVEEAYEVADACERNDLPALKDELGDLLLQVVFHARMAEEARHFTFSDVAEAICAKMIRRHPHVFAGASKGDWEGIKQTERQAAGDDPSALAGVAQGLPALLRAEKLQKRAARVGFDWPDASGPLAKIHEELDEVAAASTAEEREDEIGDLLFSVVNWARHLGVDPETALRRSSAKFERRFRAMESDSPGEMRSLDIVALEALWVQAKRLV